MRRWRTGSDFFSMDHQLLNHWMKHPEQLNRETLYELRTLLARYPYFQTARLLYLKNLFLLHDASFTEALRKAVAFVPDRKVLFYLIEGDRYVIRSRVQSPTVDEDVSVDRTLTLINAFLSEQPSTEEPIDAIPMSTATDYVSCLMHDREEKPFSALTVPATKSENLIDDFLTRKGSEEGFPQTLEELEAEARGDIPLAPVKAEPVLNVGTASVVKKQVEIETAEEDEEVLDESYFTETLAKIYVRQGRYSKALEIIKKLSLKYPKKNSYFADQIRFLEKLIINDKNK